MEKLLGRSPVIHVKSCAEHHRCSAGLACTQCTLHKSGERSFHCSAALAQSHSAEVIHTVHERISFVHLFRVSEAITLQGIELNNLIQLQ